MSIGLGERMDGILHRLEPCDHRLCVHGHAVQILCDAPRLNWPIHHALGEFATPDWPDGFSPIAGQISTYEQDVVLRHLSPQATAVGCDDLMEIYRHDDRFWLVDDRWGLCEINLLKNTWQSWVLPTPTLPAWQVTELAVLWPMSQLLRQKGLTLIPAASVARSGVGALILSPFGVEPELSALVRAGWSVVGQRWTGLRDEDGRVSLLRMPGRVERLVGPRYRGNTGATGSDDGGWVDLTQERPSCLARHAFCNVVCLVDSGRRSSAGMRPVKSGHAPGLVKSAWPTIGLHGHNRGTGLQTRLATTCTVVETHLSRRADDFVAMVEKLIPVSAQPRVTATVTAPAPRSRARPIPA